MPTHRRRYKGSFFTVTWEGVSRGRIQSIITGWSIKVQGGVRSSRSPGHFFSGLFLMSGPWLRKLSDPGNILPDLSAKLNEIQRRILGEGSYVFRTVFVGRYFLLDVTMKLLGVGFKCCERRGRTFLTFRDRNKETSLNLKNKTFLHWTGSNCFVMFRNRDVSFKKKINCNIYT